MRPQEMKAKDLFQAEIEQRLTRMKTEKPTPVAWPEGCEGSLSSWLMFVGPSPGGGKKDTLTTPRKRNAGRVLWNEDYLDPIEDWSNGFKKSMRHFVETITARLLAEGAARVFGVINFDWIQNPDASCVPQERINQGEDDVIAILEQAQPRVIVPMERRAFDQLQKALIQRRYSLLFPELTKVTILINAKSTHTDLPAYRIMDGMLKGSIVIKSPQHPARIYDEEYAKRCARAIRSTLEQLANGKSIIEIEE